MTKKKTATKKKATTKKKAVTKKAGRPRGAKTQERAIVTKLVHRSVCTACGSAAEPINKRLLREGPANGQWNGTSYNWFRHSNCECPKCGKAFLLREFDTVA